MAGHENSQVRPKATQDQNIIAAGSPLALVGIFLEIVRERFSANDGTFPYVWDADPTVSSIQIEAGYSTENEQRNVSPSIFINRVQTVPAKMAIGDRAGVRLKDHKEGFTALMTVVMQMEVISNDEGESAILGDVVQFMILTSQDVIQREFGLYDISHPTLGQTVPYSRDQNKWSTPVDFQIQFWVRWSQVPIAPLLQQILQRVSQAGSGTDSYFSEIAVTSMRRADPPETT